MKRPSVPLTHSASILSKSYVIEEIGRIVKPFVSIANTHLCIFFIKSCMTVTSNVEIVVLKLEMPFANSQNLATIIFYIIE